MSKFLYPIYKLKTKSYIKWWLYHKKAGGSGILSEILEGFSFNLANTLNRKFKLFEIEGNSTQDGTPSPETQVPILSAGDNGSINEKIINKNVINIQPFTVTGGTTSYNGRDFTVNLKAGTYTLQRKYTKSSNAPSSAGMVQLKRNNVYYKNLDGGVASTIVELTEDTALTLSFYLSTSITSSSSSSIDFYDIQLEPGSTATSYVPHSEQTYSIPTQQPMRSIGDVRDCFVKVNGVWNEKHIPYIESYNGEALPQDVYNEVDGIKYCNEKSMSTTGQFSIGASVQYIDENNWNYLPCTETQIQQLENLPSTYKEMTIINSEDETPAHLKIQYYKEG